jgi:hypothetical protein
VLRHQLVYVRFRKLSGWVRGLIDENPAALTTVSNNVHGRPACPNSDTPRSGRLVPLDLLMREVGVFAGIARQVHR